MCTDFILNILFFISVILTLDFTSFLLTVHYVRKYTRNTWTSVMLTLQKHCSEALLNQVASTRWLSLEKCVKRLLHHWPVLISYFNSHIHDVEKPERVRRVAELLRKHEDDIPHLGYVLEPLNEFNTTFQVYN